MMIHKISKDQVFYIAWILMEIHICLANSSASKFGIDFISYICMFLFVIKIIWTGQYRLSHLIFMGVIVLGSLLCTLKSKDMRVLWFALTICASKDIDIDKTIKMSFKVMLWCSATFLILCLFGVINCVTIPSTRGVRYGLGLGHPNMCSAYFLLLMIQFLYIYYDKMKIKHYILMFIGTVGIYYITRSNTGLITTILTLIISITIRYLPAKKFNTRIIVLCLFGGVALFSVLPIIYSNNWIELDALMTGRLHQANFYYVKYGISLWGKDISYDLLKWNTDNILDLGYARMLIANGVFYYALVVGGYLVTMLKSIKLKQRKLIAFLGSMIVYMYTENVATYIFMNVSMLVFSDIIFRRERNQKYE